MRRPDFSWGCKKPRSGPKISAPDEASKVAGTLMQLRSRRGASAPAKERVRRRTATQRKRRADGSMPTAGEWLALQWEDLQTERKFLSPAETYCALRLAAKAWLLDQAARGGAAAVSATLQHVPASGNVLFKLHGLEHGGATKTAILSAAAERLAQHVPLQLRSKMAPASVRGVYVAVVQRSDRTARVISHVRPLVTIAARSGAELTWGADGCEARARVYGVMEFLIVCASQENDCDDSFR